MSTTGTEPAPPLAPHRTAALRLYASTLEQAQKLVAGIDDARWAELPYDGAKHAAWTLTHLNIASGMTDAILRGDEGLSIVPAAWAELALPGSTCGADRSAYPAGGELLSTLERAHVRVEEAYRAIGDDVLAAAFPIEDYRSFWPTVADAAAYMLCHHEGYHLGQLSQWRRAIGMPALEG